MARDPGTEMWQSSKTLERGDQRKPRRLLMLPGLWGPLPLLMADLLTCSSLRAPTSPPGFPSELPLSAPDNFSSQVLPLITTWPLPGGSLCSHSQGKKSDGTAAPFVAGQLVLCILAMCSSLSQSTPAWRTESFGIF